MTVEHRAKNRGKKKKGLEQARWLWLVYQRTGQKLRKYVQIRAKDEKISNYYSELCHLCSSSICFIIVPFLSSSSSSVFVCVCVCCVVLVFVERYSLEWTDSGEKCERIVRIYDIRIIEADGLVSLIAA